MPIPVGKALMTMVRYTLRPINNTLIRTFKERQSDRNSAGYAFF